MTRAIAASVIIGLAWHGQRQEFEARSQPPHRKFQTATKAVAAVIVLVASILAIRSARTSQWIESLPVSEALVPKSAGRTEVIAFSDYQCASCKLLKDTMDPVIQMISSQSNGTVTFRRLDFPLDAKCNRQFRVPYHASACDSAIIVRLAGFVNKKDQAESYLFDHQSEVDDAFIASLVEALGVREIWSTRYSEVEADVRAEIELGISAGVRGTPVYFVNGRRALGDVSDLVAIVNAERRR
jgi:protein-disulfide isomerase